MVRKELTPPYKFLWELMTAFVINSLLVGKELITECCEQNLYRNMFTKYHPIIQTSKSHFMEACLPDISRMTCWIDAFE